MLPSFKQDISDLCHQESEYFTAVRHHSSRVDLAPIFTLDTENLLKVNTLIASQTDSVMSEAKSLLRGWIDDERVEDSIKIPSEHSNHQELKSSCTRRKVKADESLVNARNLLLDAMPQISEKRQAPKNLGLALKVRYGLAKKRRSLIEDQKRLKYVQQAAITSTVAARRLSQADTKVIENFAKDIVTTELEQLKADQAVLALARAKETVLIAEKSRLELKLKKAKEDKDAEALKAKAVFLERGYIKAEELYQQKMIHTKKDIFKSLASSLASTRKRIKSFTFKHSWSLLNQYFKTWKGKLRIIQESREYKLMALEVRSDQLKLATADRHHRLQILSKAVLSWKQCVNLSSIILFNHRA
jgi:hypothetical protein